MSQSQSQDDGMTTAGEESQDAQQMPNSSASVSLDDSLLDSQQQQGDDGNDEGDREEEEGEEVIEGKGKSKGKGGKKQQKKKTAASKQAEAGAGKASKKKQEEVEICTVRDPIARVPLPADDGSGKKICFTVLSWNVNGLRATVKNGLEMLRRMVETERPDLICFQETKLQEKDVEGMREQDILPGYASEWSCSTMKKGYAGTAVFFTQQARAWAKGGEGPKGGATPEPAKKKQKQGKMSAFFPAKDASTKTTDKDKKLPAADAAAGAADGAPESAATLPGGRSGLSVLAVRFGIGNSKHDGEGRSITVEYDKFFVVTLYVPNSGQKLERLGYRTKEWDMALRTYVKSLEAEGKPVVVNGDLNVAHLDLDIYNPGAKHLVKSAGTTKEERGSFDAWMKEGGVADAFRRLHPDARGAYTYWSMRTNARPVNKGLRLDYFVCTASLFGGGGGVGGGRGSSAGGKSPGTGKKKKARSSEPRVVVHDCFQLEAATVGLSDHCPVGLVLCITK